MTLAHTETEYDATMEKIVEYDLRGYTATQIAKETGLQRKVVVRELETVRVAWQNDAEARDLARDHLNKMVKHYDFLISKFYQLLEEIDSLTFGHQVAAQKNAALKAIADLEGKRVDTLQKAGLLESAELGDELAQWEDEKAQILDILRQLCPACRAKVGNKIAQLNGDTVPEEHNHDAIDVEVLSE